MKHSLRLAAALLLVLAAAIVAQPTTQPATQPGAKVEFDRWYQLRLNGVPCGWMHTTTLRDDTASPATLENRSETQFSLKRGPIAIDIGVTSSFLETADGEPIRAVQVQRLAKLEVVQEMNFRGRGKIEVVSKQAGQETRQTVELTAEEQKYLTPSAAQRYAQERFAAGDTTATWTMIEPSAGPKPFSTTSTVRGRENIEVVGKVVPAIVIDQTLSNLPGVVSRAHVDEELQPLKFSMPLGGMTMEVVQADEQLARAKVSPPEVIVSTFIKPNHGIDNPRELRSAVYELTLAPPREGTEHNFADGAMPLAPPRGGAQRVVWGDEKTVRVLIDLDDPVNPIDDLPTKDHLAANGALNFEDPEVKALVRRAVPEGDKHSTASKAETIRRFVHDFIHEKDLSVGSATASEVARTRVGDCTEHGVLLAALLRGAGIPSRVVTGLVYADRFAGMEHIFGYHMWVQAWIADESGGRWVDLDAVLPPDAPFDATHIALARSAMNEAGLVNDLAKLVPLLGRLQVKVIDPPAGPESATQPAEQKDAVELAPVGK